MLFALHGCCNVTIGAFTGLTGTTDLLAKYIRARVVREKLENDTRHVQKVPKIVPYLLAPQHERRQVTRNVVWIPNIKSNHSSGYAGSDLRPQIGSHTKG